MARYTDTTPATPEWLKEYADHLRRIAAMMDGNREQMVSNKIAEIQVTHHKTSQEAITRLQKFVGAIAEAVAHYPSHQSTQPKTSKKAGSTEKPPKK
jgi:hypothetical protein